ncbi:PP2C family protein-serine/threonine phosphatase [Knoellia sp. S7-12]|uniref:PP2C family protein-serine/threonine phosphatase n=1 Tax=Knoellia sp. S7-12 TaxID=3126698 RepID=UPI003365C211
MPGEAGPPTLSLSSGEQVLDALRAAARFCGPHELPAIVAEHARLLGVSDATIHLVDLQQLTLTPFHGPVVAGAKHEPAPLDIDSTIAGRAYQHSVVLVAPSSPEHGSGTTVWLPLCESADRIGVLSVVFDDVDGVGEPDPVLATWLHRLAALVGELVALKKRYGDSIVMARRSTEVDLAAEIQWGLLPPLTFGSRDVSVAAVLEPAYDVAGDSVDYAVDTDIVRLGVFDGMGHGLQSAQLASLAVESYRNARRAGRSLTETAAAIDQAIERGFSECFTTAVLAELCTSTGELSWISAGHPAPLLLRSGRVVRTLHVDPGLPFGLGLPDTDHHYPVQSEQLESGDQVLFLTDGVLDARSPSGDHFGVERLADLLSHNIAASLSPAESMRRVGRALLQHQEARLTDDATMLLMEWPGHQPGLTSAEVQALPWPEAPRV